MTKVSLSSSSTQVMTNYSKSQYSSNSDAASSFCSKIQQIWKRFCSLLSSIFCCKSTRKEIKKPKISSNPIPQQKPLIPKQPLPAKPENSIPSTPSTPIHPKPLTPKTDGVDRFSKLPSVNQNQVFEFLDLQDIFSFAQTSQANRSASQNNNLWRQLLARHFPELGQVSSTTDAKEIFKKLIIKEFTFKTRIDKNDGEILPDGDGLDLRFYSNFYSQQYQIPYLEGITTVEQLLKKIAAKTGYPLEKIRIYYFDGENHLIGIKDKEVCKQPFSILQKLSEAWQNRIVIRFCDHSSRQIKTRLFQLL